jgi:hypothetical protein
LNIWQRFRAIHSRQHQPREKYGSLVKDFSVNTSEWIERTLWRYWFPS